MAERMGSFRGPIAIARAPLVVVNGERAVAGRKCGGCSAKAAGEATEGCGECRVRECAAGDRGR